MAIPVRIKSFLLVLAKITVTVLIFYLIARKVNISDVLNTPVQNKSFLFLAFALAIGVVIIQGLRWHLLCKFLGVGTGIFRNIKAVWAGHLLNNVLPTSAVGDVLRSYSLRGRGAERTKWVSALLVEKYFAVITALFLAGVLVVFNQLPKVVPSAIKMIVLSIFVAGVCVSMVMHITTLVGANLLPLKFRRFLSALSSIISTSIKDRTGVMTLLTSLVVNVLICLVFFCIAQAMGVRITINDCLFIVPVFTILAGLPISYGGWGVREMTSIHLLQYYGVGSEIALTTTIFFGISIFLSSLPGVFFLPAFRNALIGKEEL